MNILIAMLCRQKIKSSLINDLEDARNAITMLIDEAEDDEVAGSLENADEKMAEVIENLDKAVRNIK
ncbi:MAG: hypothetical protein IJ899_18290 [Blautia sp.]|nr:hypothetical protein [Blautia sp.]